MKVTRLAFGTGTNNGQVQRELGQEEFTSWCVTRTTAGSVSLRARSHIRGMHEMLGIALKGIPRENYRLMTKVTTGDGKNPQAED